MKVGRAILAGGATVQFSSLALAANAHTRALGFVTGMITGVIFLLLAIDVKPMRPLVRTRRRGG